MCLFGFKKDMRAPIVHYAGMGSLILSAVFISARIYLIHNHGKTNSFFGKITLPFL